MGRGGVDGDVLARSPEAPIVGGEAGIDTFANRLWFGVGQGGEGIATTAMSLLLFYYSQVLGLDARLAGLALLIAIVTDGVSDLLVGAWSDGFRHRWGRRHPFMYASVLPFGAAFAGLFLAPPGLSQGALFAWLLIASLIARNAMTLFVVPHYALGAELSTNHHGRTTVVAFRSFFQAIGRVLVFAAGVVMFAPTAQYHAGQLNPGRYPLYGLVLGAIIVLATWSSARGTHNTIAALAQPKAGERFGVVKAFSETWAAARTPAFAIFLIGFLVWVIGQGVYLALTVYMNTYFWRLSTQQVFLLPLASAVATLAATPLWVLVAKVIGKKASFIGAGLGLSGVVAAMVLSRIWGVIPLTGPVYLAIVFGGTMVAGGLAAAPFVVAGSMLADIADDYELRSGKRREGILFGAINFATKVSGGLGPLIGGLLITAAGLHAKADPSAVATAVSDRLALTTIAALAGFGISASLLYLVYPLNHARHAEIQAQLAARTATGGDVP